MDDLDDLDAIALAQWLEPRRPTLPLDEGERLIDDELPLRTDETGCEAWRDYQDLGEVVG